MREGNVLLVLREVMTKSLTLMMKKEYFLRNLKRIKRIRKKQQYNVFNEMVDHS